MIIDLYLLPWTLLKWVGSLFMWVFAIHMILQSDTWYNFRDFLKKKHEEIREYIKF